MTARDHYFPVFDRWMRQLAGRDLILDLGTPHRFRKELKPYEPIFRRTRYYTMDYKVKLTEGPDLHPDVDGNVCVLPFRDEVAGAVICKDVLEHVADPQRAVWEIHRVLKPGGIVFCSVPFIHPFHRVDREKYPDFWRFTKDGVEQLFSNFRTVDIVPAGGALFVLRTFMPLWLRSLLFPSILMPVVNAIDTHLPTRNLTHMFLIFANK